MKIILLTFLLLVLMGHSMCEESLPVRYDNFKVYEAFVQNYVQLEEFKKLENNIPVIYLNDVGAVDRPYYVVVGPEYQQALEDCLQYLQIPYKLTIDNLQQLIDQSLTPAPSHSMEWTKYHPLSDIYSWVDSLEATYNESFHITTYIIGYTYEKRPIKAVKVSSYTPGPKKVIFIESSIHAIEWISSATSTCFFKNLLTSEDENVRYLTLKYDWVFVPVLNPDGFEYSHHVERVWRKNRSPTGFSNKDSGPCFGTDLNRNFNAHWNEAGFRVDIPCAHWYAGQEADGETELQALQGFVNSFPEGSIRIYLAIHSFGNYLLLPYGHTNTTFPPNYDQMMRISKGFAEKAIVKYGTVFQYGASGILNYPVSGSAKDWAYVVKNVPFTATIELRDRGTYGFFLPPEQIVEVCAEFTDGIVGLVSAAELEHIFD